MVTNFELFFNRMKNAANATTDKELCDFLEIKKSTLSMWKKREVADYVLLFTKFEHIDYNWLFKGEEMNNNGKVNSKVNGKVNGKVLQKVAEPEVVYNCSGCKEKNKELAACAERIQEYKERIQELKECIQSKNLLIYSQEAEINRLSSNSGASFNQSVAS